MTAILKVIRQNSRNHCEITFYRTARRARYRSPVPGSFIEIVPPTKEETGQNVAATAEPSTLVLPAILDVSGSKAISIRLVVAGVVFSRVFPPSDQCAQYAPHSKQLKQITRKHGRQCQPL